MGRKTTALITLAAVVLLIISAATGCERPVETGAEQQDEEQDTFPPNAGIVLEAVADVFNEPDLKATRLTQVLFNQPVEVLEEKDGWMKIQTTDGTSGWLRSRYVGRDLTSIKSSLYKYRIIITSKNKKASSHAKGGITVKDVGMGTEFYSRGRLENNYEIALPGNVMAWVSESGTIQLEIGEDIPVTTAEDFVLTAVKFKGTSYLTGGVSAWGIDASGLIYTCAKINGVELPRELSAQFKMGRTVDVNMLSPGDLLFFNLSRNEDEISHAGIYAGNGEFIHSSPTKGYVSVSPLEEDNFFEKLVGAKRIFMR